MPVTVVQAASSYDLTTVDRVADELALSSTEKTNNQTLLERLVTRASDTVRSITDRSFAEEQVEERLFVRRMSPRLMLSRTPIVSIDKIELNGDAITADSYFVEDADSGFIFREDDFFDSTAIFGGHFVERASKWGRYDWKVTYTAGYVLPSFSSGTPNLPLDIERAAIELVSSWFRSRDTDPNVTSEKIGDSSVDYRDRGPGGIPETTRMTLERWRRFD